MNDSLLSSVNRREESPKLMGDFFTQPKIKKLRKEVKL